MRDDYPYTLNEEARDEAVAEAKEWLRGLAADARAELAAELAAIEAEANEEAERLLEEEPELLSGPIICGQHFDVDDRLESRVAKKLNLRPWKVDQWGRQWYRPGIKAVPSHQAHLYGGDDDLDGDDD
jgi:hypothetical protein